MLGGGSNSKCFMISHPLTNTILSLRNTSTHYSHSHTPYSCASICLKLTMAMTGCQPETCPNMVKNRANTAIDAAHSILSLMLKLTSCPCTC